MLIIWFLLSKEDFILYKLTYYSHLFMLFSDFYEIPFFTFCVFLYIIISIVNFAKAIKKMSINKIKDFIFENYYEEIGFSKTTVIIQ